MSKMVKVVTSKKTRRGKTTINSKCEITFDENCVGKIPEKNVEELLKLDSSLRLLDKELAAKFEEKENIGVEELKEQVNVLAQQVSEKDSIILKLQEENKNLTESNDKLKAIQNKVVIAGVKDGTYENSQDSGNNKDPKINEPIDQEETDKIRLEAKIIEDKVKKLSPEAQEKVDRLREEAKKQLKKSLEDMDLIALKKICEDYNLPKEIWDKFTTKKDIIPYIMSK